MDIEDYREMFRLHFKNAVLFQQVSKKDLANMTSVSEKSIDRWIAGSQPKNIKNILILYKEVISPYLEKQKKVSEKKHKKIKEDKLRDYCSKNYGEKWIYSIKGKTVVRKK